MPRVRHKSVPIPKMFLLLLVLIGCLLVLPVEARAGAWVLPAGHLWVKSTVMHQVSHDEFVAVSGGGRGNTPSRTYRPGQPAPYRFGGRHTWTGVFSDIAWGLADRLEVGIQVPYYSQDYSDAQDALFLEPRGQSGLGDLRVRGKVRLSQRPAAISAELAIKIPTAAYRNRDGLVTVTDGQWDLESVAHVGWSLWPLRAYVNLSGGYRLRLENRSVGRDPGDEWLFAAECGFGIYRSLSGIVKVEGIHGKPARSLGLEVPSDVRRAVFVFPSLSVKVGRGAVVEAGIRYPVSGRNFPAGRMLVAAVSWTADLSDAPNAPFRR